MEDRLCNFDICDVVEDEVHALCKCKKFDTFRQQMYLIIKKKLNICKPENEIFIDTLTSTDIDILEHFQNSGPQNTHNTWSVGI